MIRIQEISTPGCGHCAMAKKILEADVKPNFPSVKVEYVDILSKEGQKMIRKYNITISPGIIINNELFSVGEVDRNKLIKKIKSLA